MIEITGYTGEEVVEFVKYLKCPDEDGTYSICDNYQDCYECLVKYYSIKTRVV